MGSILLTCDFTANMFMAYLDNLSKYRLRNLGDNYLREKKEIKNMMKSSCYWTLYLLGQNIMTRPLFNKTH